MTYARSLFRELLEAGDIEPTGEMRPNGRGELEPVYHLTEQGKKKAEQIFCERKESESE